MGIGNLAAKGVTAAKTAAKGVSKGALAAKAAAGVGGRMLAGLAGGPVGETIALVGSVAFLYDMVRSFMDGGEDNVDPKEIAAQRDKAVADLVKGGTSPEEARAQVDDLLRPLVEGVEAGRDREATSTGEFLTDAAIVGGGLLAGRHARKKAKHGEVHDAPKDTATLSPKGKSKSDYDDVADGLDKPRKGDPREELYEHEVPEMDRPPTIEPGVSESERGFQAEFGEPTRGRGYTTVRDDRMGEDELRRMAVASEMRGTARRPPPMYRRGEGEPLRLGVSEETLANIGRRGRPATLSPEELELLELRRNRMPAQDMGGWGGEGY